MFDRMVRAIVEKVISWAEPRLKKHSVEVSGDTACGCPGIRINERIVLLWCERRLAEEE